MSVINGVNGVTRINSMYGWGSRSNVLASLHSVYGWGSRLPSYAIVPCGHAPAFTDWPDKDIDKETSGFRGKSPRCLFERNPDDMDYIMLGWADRDHDLIQKGFALFPGMFKLQDCPGWLKQWHTYLIESPEFRDSPHLSFKDRTNHTAKYKVNTADQHLSISSVLQDSAFY